jgi:hypothetical protein
VRFSERSIQTGGRTRNVLVVSADTDTLFGREKLEELRSNPNRGLFGSVADHVEHGAIPHAVCFRGRGADGSGQFRMAASLDDAELSELGYRLMRALLPAFRRIAKRGVEVIAAVELRVREQASLRKGTDRLLTELRDVIARGDPARRTRAVDDGHLLERVVSWSGLGLQSALDHWFPRRFMRPTLVDGIDSDLRARPET